MKNWKDIYELPFVRYCGHSWMYDKKGQFAFQIDIHNEKVETDLISVINDVKNFENEKLVFTHKNGKIQVLLNDGDDKLTTIITIRGWGNLTSPNCNNLSDKEAANVQDTLADFLLSRLNDRTTKK